MKPGEVFGRGIAFPPRVGTDGQMAWSEGEQNVRESIQIILLTNPRERVGLPAFGGGLSSFLFAENNPTTHHLMADRITRALATWEPRIAVENIRVEPDPRDSEAAVATIHYKLVATQTRERLSLTVPLGR